MNCFERWDRQLRFILEVDKLKTVFSKSPIMSNIDRFENIAEHAWHSSLVAITLLEYATNKENINLFQVLKMLLIHDLVELGARNIQLVINDTKQNRNDAVNRLLSILPEDQHLEIFKLWKEFEEKKTFEAKYAAVVNQVQPFLDTYFTENNTCLETEINLEQELEFLREMVPTLRDYAIELKSLDK